MVSTEELKREAWEVNDLLSEYVALHNHLLKSAGTFSSLFRKIDFGKLSEETSSLLEKFRNKGDELKVLAEGEVRDEGRQFTECLLSYTNALTETVGLLYVMYQALKGKASGNKLSFKEHLENNKKYQESIKEYVRQGEQLNNLFRSL
ncbi:hypothetical protein D4R99_00725 [bacterium]|nr:MAG: hypothetical protein D4R99_00725 [bacterium]